MPRPATTLAAEVVAGQGTPVEGGPDIVGDAAATARVLVVDDERAIVIPVARHLRREGYDVAVAASAEAALDCLDAESFDIVITDISMAGLSGLDLLQRIKARDAQTRVIIMTAHAEPDLAIRALRLDADDYLVKPFELQQLSHSVRRSVQQRWLVTENQAYRTRLEDRVRDQARRLQGLYLAGIRALITALEAKDSRTRGHSDRVTQFALRIAETLGGADARALAVGAALHDIGKIGTRDDVLSKPGPLTEDEVRHIREHPVIGERILSAMLDDAVILGVVRHHHERWDGAGYPDGLAGRAIPLSARIVAVADSLDAITSPRAYRPTRSWTEAMEEIVACSGTQFDPAVVAAALVSLRERPAPETASA